MKEKTIRIVLGISAFFVFAFMISLIPGETPSETNTYEVEKEVREDVINAEIEYTTFSSEFNYILVDSLQIVSDTSTMTANGEITLYQAGILYETTAEFYDVALNALDSVDVPVKYNLVHKHNRLAVVYYKQAMLLAAEGSYTNNVDLIYEGVEYIYLANSEIEKATSILKTF